MRYSLKSHDGRFFKSLGWNKKSHVEAWIQQYLKSNGGLDWRAGALFKAKNSNNSMEVVWTKDGSSIDWFNIEPAPLTEYNPAK